MTAFTFADVAFVAPNTAAAFSPLTGLAWHSAWWAGDPAWTPPSDGSTAQTWRQGSGSAIGDLSQATAGARPTFRASSANMNSKPIVEFRTDDTMEVTFTALTQRIDVICVGRFNTVSGAIQSMWSGNDTTHRAGFYVNNNFTRYEANASASSIVGPTSGADTTRHLFRVSYNGASSAIFVNGTSIVSGNCGTDALDALRLGLNTGGTSFGDIDIAFIGIYVGDPTADAGWAAFKAWVTSEYSITVA